MTWLVAALATVAAIELLLRLPLRREFSGLTATIGKAGRVIAAPRISDHWKEKVLLIYSRKIFQHTITLCALACIALLPLALVAGFSDPVLRRLLSLEGIALCTLIAVVYLAIRRRYAN